MAVILVDQDGVIADMESKLLDRIMDEFPASERIPLEDRTTFYIDEQYPLVTREWTWDVLGEDGFYRDLPVMPGARESIAQLLVDGHTVKICTSPIWSPYCIRDKYLWIAEHFPDLRGHIITSNDKTLIRGDILIDDKEPISGFYDDNPEWVHLPFKSGKRNSGTFDWNNMGPLYELIEKVSTEQVQKAGWI